MQDVGGHSRAGAAHCCRALACVQVLPAVARFGRWAARHGASAVVEADTQDIPGVWASAGHQVSTLATTISTAAPKMIWHALLHASGCCLQLCMSSCPSVAVPGMQSCVTCMLAVSLLKHLHRVSAHRGMPSLRRRLSGAISWWCAWQACSLTLLSQMLGGMG